MLAYPFEDSLLWIQSRIKMVQIFNTSIQCCGSASPWCGFDLSTCCGSQFLFDVDPIFHSDADLDPASHLDENPNFYLMRIRINNTAWMTPLRGIRHTTFLDCAAESRIVLVEKLRDAHSLLQTSSSQGHFHSLKVCRISVSPGQKSMKRKNTTTSADVSRCIFILWHTGE